MKQFKSFCPTHACTTPPPPPPPHEDPTPATALTPRQYRWRRRPRRDGSAARVALVSSLSAGRPRCTGVRRAGVIVGLAAEHKKLIVESAALASNGNPLIFDAPNEMIVGAADIENNSGDASSDTSGGGKGFMGGEEGV